MYQVPAGFVPVLLPATSAAQQSALIAAIPASTSTATDAITQQQQQQSVPQQQQQQIPQTPISQQQSQAAAQPQQQSLISQQQQQPQASIPQQQQQPQASIPQHQQQPQATIQQQQQQQPVLPLSTILPNEETAIPAELGVRRESCEVAEPPSVSVLESVAVDSASAPLPPSSPAAEQKRSQEIPKTTKSNVRFFVSPVVVDVVVSVFLSTVF